MSHGSQCVPDWELEDPPNNSHEFFLDPSSTSVATTMDVSAAAIGSRSEYEVEELTWVNGHPFMQGHGQLRIGKSSTAAPKYPFPMTWDKILTGGGTLESVVDQATGAILFPADYDLVPWIPPGDRRVGVDDSPSPAAAAADALVPEPSTGWKRKREENCSVSGSAASMARPFTISTSPLDGSPENTSCWKTVTAADEHDSVGQSLQDGGFVEEDNRKDGDVVSSSVSTKRSRAAAVHNQSERKRRDRINQRMKTLQKLVPNSSKTDKASMLDEVIEYLKQLQAQVQMMNRMNVIPHMMMTAPMQQMQMAMMAQMAQVGMGMGMAINPLAPRTSTQPTALPQPCSSPFFPFINPTWDVLGVCPQPPADPFSAFMACQQPQNPLNMDAFNMMASMYHPSFQQPPPPPPPPPPPSLNIDLK